MFDIEFKYRDEWSHWEWRTQHCRVSSVEECIKIYGLNHSDVEYEIIKVTPVN